MITLVSITSLLESKSLNFNVEGKNISIKKISAIDSNVEDSVCYYVGENPSHLKGIRKSIIICKAGTRLDPDKTNSIIYTDNPQLCFYHISKLFDEETPTGIHNLSAVDSNSCIGKNITIGPFCNIENSIIGDNVIIGSNVMVHKGTIIGNNVRIESNSVIGATGVMWTWDAYGNKITCSQCGKTIIEDDVFIGSNITICRGAFENKPTIIGQHTSIAHGTMLGHGSVIGEYNHFANNVAIAGSVQTGRNCFFGSGVSVRPHIVFQNDVIIGAGAVVVKEYSESGITLIGNPAKKLLIKKDVQSGVPAPYVPKLSE